MNKKFIAKLLALAMVLAMVPATFLAASATDSNETCPGNETCPTGPSNPSNPTCPGTSTSTPSDTTVVVPTTTVEEIPEDGAIEVEVVSGTANVVLSEKAVESLAEMAKNGEIVLEINDEGATKLNVTLPAAALTELAKKTGADLTIKSTVATITIPNSVLVNEMGTVGNVKISVQNTGNSVSFSIQVSGQELKGVKGIKVEF